MDKQKALDTLKEHGIELVLVTDRTYKWDHIDLARKDYDIPDDAVVPTKEQYDNIIGLVGEDGLYNIIEEYMEYGFLRLWSSFESSSSSWNLFFYSGYSGQAYWHYHTKANGFSLAFLRFMETQKQKEIKHLEKTIAGLQKKLNSLTS